MVNTGALAEHPPNQRAALESACADTIQWILRQYDLDNIDALARLPAQGVQRRRFPPELMAAFARSSDELLTELERQDPTRFDYVYQEWRRFRDRIRTTIDVTEFRTADQPA